MVDNQDTTSDISNSQDTSANSFFAAQNDSDIAQNPDKGIWIIWAILLVIAVIALPFIARQRDINSYRRCLPDFDWFLKSANHIHHPAKQCLALSKFVVWFR